jgi:hypothetical protein
MWVPALRRFVQLFLVIGAGTVAVSIALGFLLGSTLERSISLGFYLVGCFLLLGAFFYGIRGPLRPSSPDEQDPGVFTGIGSRRIRWATKEEQAESINTSAVFLTLGLVMLILGVVSDSSHALF